MKSINLISWSIYGLFVLLAVLFNREDPFTSGGPFSLGKYLFWILFIVFTVYTIRCSQHESLFSTVRKMNKLHWGRQIGLDLYIGLIMFILLIYLHQGSALIATLWALPILAFGNLATLLYVALHFDSLINTLV